jgi:hypothetical protein
MLIVAHVDKQYSAFYETRIVIVTKIFVVWDVTPCRWCTETAVSEEPTASFLKVKELKWKK